MKIKLILLIESLKVQKALLTQGNDNKNQLASNDQSITVNKFKQVNNNSQTQIRPTSGLKDIKQIRVNKSQERPKTGKQNIRKVYFKQSNVRPQTAKEAIRPISAQSSNINHLKEYFKYHKTTEFQEELDEQFEQEFEYIEQEQEETEFSLSNQEINYKKILDLAFSQVFEANVNNTYISRQQIKSEINKHQLEVLKINKYLTYKIQNKQCVLDNTFTKIFVQLLIHLSKIPHAFSESIQLVFFLTIKNLFCFEQQLVQQLTQVLELNINEYYLYQDLTNQLLQLSIKNQQIIENQQQIIDKQSQEIKDIQFTHQKNMYAINKELKDTKENMQTQFQQNSLENINLIQNLKIKCQEQDQQIQIHIQEIQNQNELYKQMEINRREKQKKELNQLNQKLLESSQIIQNLQTFKDNYETNLKQRDTLLNENAIAFQIIKQNFDDKTKEYDILQAKYDKFFPRAMLNWDNLTPRPSFEDVWQLQEEIQKTNPSLKIQEVVGNNTKERIQNITKQYRDVFNKMQFVKQSKDNQEEMEKSEKNMLSSQQSDGSKSAKLSNQSQNSISD